GHFFFIYVGKNLLKLHGEQPVASGKFLFFLDISMLILNCLCINVVFPFFFAKLYVISRAYHHLDKVL
ncbi:hypothetical protein ACJX0J_013382, partial [Zea mays]